MVEQLRRSVTCFTDLLPFRYVQIVTLPEVVYSCSGCFISRSYPSYADIICRIDLNQMFPNRKHNDQSLYLYLLVAPVTTIISQYVSNLDLVSARRLGEIFHLFHCCLSIWSSYA